MVLETDIADRPSFSYFTLHLNHKQGISIITNIKMMDTIKYRKIVENENFIEINNAPKINQATEAFRNRNNMKKYYTEENINIFKDYRNTLNDLIKQTEKLMKTEIVANYYRTI